MAYLCFYGGSPAVTRWTGSVLRWVTVRIQPSHAGQLSLAIPSWVGKMSTGNGTAIAREETASSA